uniref:Uncharacterized protein n=1 Tax=Acrobeloides nanus TaxID=290746 RepID=A0A914CF52_9BILA
MIRCKADTTESWKSRDGRITSKVAEAAVKQIHSCSNHPKVEDPEVNELIGHFHQLQIQGEVEEGTWLLDYLDVDWELYTAKNQSLTQIVGTQELSECEEEESDEDA